MKRVPRTPVLPSSAAFTGAAADMGALQRTLQQTITEHSNRLNESIPADGSEPLDVPFPLAVFATADLPDPTTWEGGLVIVTDGGPGGTPAVAFSDGTNWVFTGTGNGDLKANNNLDDVDNAATAFDNIKQSASTSYTGVLEIATDAEVRSAAGGDKAIMAAHLETASEPVTLTDAATIALDWQSGFTFEVEITTDRILGNPSNGIPGTFRTVYVISDGGPDELTFASAYGGIPPAMDDITTTKAYLISIYCVSTTHFIAVAVDGSPP